MVLHVGTNTQSSVVLRAIWGHNNLLRSATFVIIFSLYRFDQALLDKVDFIQHKNLLFDRICMNAFQEIIMHLFGDKTRF